MKIVTFNIRCDYGQDGSNNFCYRKPLVLKKIAQEQPDIICFQEVIPDVAVWLKEVLTEYYIIGCGRSETLEDEQVAIAYRKDRMNLIQMDTYWLSERPQIPGSRYPNQSICPRVCTETLFEDLKTKLVFRLVNTHLDHEGAMARKLALRQILCRTEQKTFMADAPVILTGDMNADPDSDEMSVMKDYPAYVNVTENIGITFHGFMRCAPACIDYIFVKGKLVCKKVEKWMDEENGVYLSDHYPVCACLESEK
ncbi:MAG: endonuclease/exonuclease/phosphatase family protein [Lachnospiraceae bacterium]